MKRIILASASLRRKQLLEQIGLEFKVDPCNSTEAIDIYSDPHTVAKSLSMRKAFSIANKYRNAVVIAADTLGFFEGQILGKPGTADEACEMLSTMSGKSHSVITGFTVLDTDTNKAVSKSIETMVWFRKLAAEEIDAYVKSGEPLDKAGAYGIQGLGAVLIERIDGDYFNVMGLPLSALSESLKEFGISVL